MLKATLHANCRDCVVSYATGTTQSKHDTLHGVFDENTGDTIAEERQWSVELKDGDNLYFAACRLHEDTAFGTLTVWVDGEVRPDQASADTSEACAVVNHTVHPL